MKDQYFGDERDYLKYSIIRNATEHDLTCTIAWMMTPNDNSGQGLKTGYLQEPDLWRDHDPSVFNYLHDQYVVKGRRECRAMEVDGPIKHCNFFSETVPGSRRLRQGYLQRCLETADSSALVFFDPDIGVYRKGVRSWEENQYLFWDEIKITFLARHSLMVYQHLPYGGRDSFVERRTQLFRSQLQTKHVFAMCAKEVAFFFACQLEHLSSFMDAQAAIKKAWYPKLWLHSD